MYWARVASAPVGAYGRPCACSGYGPAAPAWPCLLPGAAGRRRRAGRLSSAAASRHRALPGTAMLSPGCATRQAIFAARMFATWCTRRAWAWRRRRPNGRHDIEYVRALGPARLRRPGRACYQVQLGTSTGWPVVFGRRIPAPSFPRYRHALPQAVLLARLCLPPECLLPGALNQFQQRRLGRFSWHRCDAKVCLQKKPAHCRQTWCYRFSRLLTKASFAQKMVGNMFVLILY